MLECVKILYRSVCGVEWEYDYYGEYGYYREWRAKTAREVWKEEGKGKNKEGEGEEEGEQRRREWERKWREGVDVMIEEDVIESVILHLCIAASNDYGFISPSGCSWKALEIVKNETLNRRNTYHFPLYDLSKQPENVAIIRNIPSEYYSAIVKDIKKRIESICPILSSEEVRAGDLKYGVMRVTVERCEDALNVVRYFDGCMYNDSYLGARMNMREMGGECDSVIELLYCFNYDRCMKEVFELAD